MKNLAIARRCLYLSLAILAASISMSHRALAAAPPQSDQEQLYNQAVQDYTQNHFSDALAKFQKVSGAHSRDAQQYAAKIKTYMDAIQVARSITSRSQDELDSNSLAYAIQKYQEAIKIKADGPWHPIDEMEKAATLKAALERKDGERRKTMDRDFCNRALAAAQEHHFKEAARFSCPLANDDPGYECGGDEAVRMCEQMTELAKMDKPPDRPIGGEHGTKGDRDNPHPASAAAFDRGKELFDKNDFDKARKQFGQAPPEFKGAADEYLDKISRYQDAMKQADQFRRNSEYEAAGAQFRLAASIKADGPGNPQAQALRMELFLGLDKFYSGDYVSAAQNLQDCVRQGNDGQSLARFYLGASKLARYYLSGGEDANLQREALDDLKVAKQGGFKADGQDVSPRILRAYQDLAF